MRACREGTGNVRIPLVVGCGAGERPSRTPAARMDEARQFAEGDCWRFPPSSTTMRTCRLPRSRPKMATGAFGSKMNGILRCGRASRTRTLFSRNSWKWTAPVIAHATWRTRNTSSASWTQRRLPTGTRLDRDLSKTAYANYPQQLSKRTTDIH